MSTSPFPLGACKVKTGSFLEFNTLIFMQLSLLKPHYPYLFSLEARIC